MRDCQRFVIGDHPQAVLAKLGHKVIARTRGAFDMPLTGRIEGGSELDPELALVDEVAPHARAIAAHQHRIAHVARRVENDLVRRNDGFDCVAPPEDGLVAVWETRATRTRASGRLAGCAFRYAASTARMARSAFGCESAAAYTASPVT